MEGLPKIHSSRAEEASPVSGWSRGREEAGGERNGQASYPSLLFLRLEAKQPFYNSLPTFSTSPSFDANGTIPRKFGRLFVEDFVEDFSRHSAKARGRPETLV